MEITQFTYFQQMTGIDCKPVPVELTYGLERLCMFVQGKKNVFDIEWNREGVKYKDVYYQSEKEFSAYNFEYADTKILLSNFEYAEKECKVMLVEPKGVVNTGESSGDLTAQNDVWI